jgi:hypothetical protein
MASLSIEESTISEIFFVWCCDLTGLPELGYTRPVARGTSEWFGSGGETSRVR